MEGKEMENLIEWLRKKLGEQQPQEHDYFCSYVIGVLKTEMGYTPNKTYTVAEVIEILKMINDARFRY
jgi:hypothetical protein